MRVNIEARTPGVADQRHAPIFCQLHSGSVGGGEGDHDGYAHAGRFLQHLRADATGGEQDRRVE